ncbi:MAG: glutamate mutase L, partial [Planctomycetota bacterium]
PRGATTDVFSVFNETFNRTVSANLGMSYSLGNVLIEAGIDNICRWLPFEANKNDIINRLRNKMIRPTTIPHALEDLLIEQSVGRECLRLAFEHHCMLAVGLKGIQQQRTIADTFMQIATGQTLINMLQLNLIVGSGGVLSHAPSRNQAALMLIDGFQPEGITELAVDSIFMMPQLGVLSKVMPEAAVQVFHRDCLIYLGTCIAPKGEVQKEGVVIAKIEIELPEEKTEKIELKSGEIKVIPLAVGQTAKAKIQPSRKFDVGAGAGEEKVATLRGGTTGIILDGRGRPLTFSKDQNDRIRKNREWLTAFSLPF